MRKMTQEELDAFVDRAFPFPPRRGRPQIAPLRGIKRLPGEGAPPGRGVPQPRMPRGPRGARVPEIPKLTRRPNPSQARKGQRKRFPFLEGGER